MFSSLDEVAMPVGGGSVINGAYPVYLTNINSTGQHIISREDPLFITGSPSERQDHPLKQYIPYGMTVYERLVISCLNVAFKRT